MNKYLALIITTILMLIWHYLPAQSDKCATMLVLEKRIQKDPSTLLRMEQLEQKTQNWIERNRASIEYREVVTIPVVVHVLWNTPAQNISDEQIFSQIDVLNEDFRHLNPDSLIPTHPFHKNTADTEIEFCLASYDPFGNPTSGITRTQTPVTVWTEDDLDNLFFNSSGGKDNWQATQYLNIYVANLEPDFLGFASFPSDLIKYPEYDGVVIRPEAFGTTGTAGTIGYFENMSGRTATHEVGHWLNLRHIWGDRKCGNDRVDDTVPAEDANYGCPGFPRRAFNSCGSDEHGEMYMNYMDYVDDACMKMFTKGQALRMQAALNGPRSGILSSEGCQPVSISTLGDNYQFEVYPNPASDEFTITIRKQSGIIKVINSLGTIVMEKTFQDTQTIKIHMNEKTDSGFYIIRIISGKNVFTRKLIISK